jgi:hypothetical protein
LLEDKTGKEFAALDLHYLSNGKVSGTLILFENVGVSEELIPEILKRVDESLLPEVNIEEGNLSFTVVKGHVLGSYVPHAHESLKK